METNQLEETILSILNQNGIWFKIKGIRYDGVNSEGYEQYHNWYIIGRDEEHTFGELDFSKNPVWRLSWYSNGKIHRDSGYILTNFDKLLKEIKKLSLPGIKLKQVDDKKAELEKDFE
jgi:hypothetical protein